MEIMLFAGFVIVLGVPLVLCLNAMGRQIRADFERGAPDRIATIPSDCCCAHRVADAPS